MVINNCPDATIFIIFKNDFQKKLLQLDALDDT